MTLEEAFRQNLRALQDAGVRTLMIVAVGVIIAYLIVAVWAFVRVFREDEE